MKILLIEDNIQISSNIVRFLSNNNIHCDIALDWEIGLQKSLSNHYDVIILDINLPKINWLEILKKIRERWKDTQIIMLTSNSSKNDIISGLNFWADDYLTKPFDFDELFARLNTLNRRNLKNKSNIIKFWDYILDIDKTILINQGNEIKLSNLEFNLLKYLVQNMWKSISRQELYEKVWGEFDWDIMFSKTVDVYIWYLRKKLNPEIIETIKWVWYKLKK